MEEPQLPPPIIDDVVNDVDNDIDILSTTSFKQVETFDEMNLPRLLLRGIYSAGFNEPSQIQKRSIASCIDGGDVLAQAPSGTGKTGAFVISILARISNLISAMATTDDEGGAKEKAGSVAKTRVVILSPTRELAIQTFECVKKLGKYLQPEVSSVECFIGGTLVRNDISKAITNPTIVVGTPGRILDLARRGSLRLEELNILVLDEADELLSQGFSDSIKEFLTHVNKDSQVLLFSATVPEEIILLSKRIMREPSTRILVKKEMVNLEGLKQTYVSVEEKDKLETLCDLYQKIAIAQCVIFCYDRRKVDWLSAQLEKRGHTVSRLHGEMEHSERSVVFDSFRTGRSRVLVSTDVFGRGIDVPSVSIVINYDLPRDTAQYVHRVGRCSRYGKRGMSINFVSPRDAPIQTEIETLYKINITKLLNDDFRKHNG